MNSHRFVAASTLLNRIRVSQMKGKVAQAELDHGLQLTVEDVVHAENTELTSLPDFLFGVLPLKTPKASPGKPLCVVICASALRSLHLFQLISL